MAECKDISGIKKHITDFKKSDLTENLSDDYIAGYMCALSVFERIMTDLSEADEPKNYVEDGWDTK